MDKLDSYFNDRIILLNKNYFEDGFITFNEYMECVKTLCNAYLKLKNLK